MTESISDGAGRPVGTRGREPSTLAARATFFAEYTAPGGGMNHFQVMGLRALFFAVFLSPLAAQWISYPTAGVPRTPDGKPDLNAACPRTADGKPDLSGLWVMQPNR